MKIGGIRHNHKLDGDQKEILRTMRLVASLGLTVVLAILGFFFGGLWLRRWLDTGYWLVFVMMGLGIALSFYWTYLKLSREAGFARKPLPDGEPDKRE